MYYTLYQWLKTLQKTFDQSSKNGIFFQVSKEKKILKILLIFIEFETIHSFILKKLYVSVKIKMRLKSSYWAP